MPPSNCCQLPTAMKSNKPSAALRSELRGLIALFAVDKAMKLGEMKIAEQQNEVHKIFHGDKKNDRVSHVAMLAKGEDMFSNLLKQDPDKPDQKRLQKIFLPSESSIVLGVQIKQSFLEQCTFKSRALVTGRTLLELAKDHTRHIRKAMSIMHKHVDKNTGEPLRSGSTVASVAENILDDMWVIHNDTNGPSKKESPEDEGDDDSPEGGNSPSSGNVIEARSDNWFFPGFMSLMFFGPFKENMEAERVLDLFIPKDPPAEHKKEFSRVAARKKAAARESAIRSIDPSRGMTKKDLMDERRVKAKEDELKTQVALASSELLMRVRDGMHKELDLLHKTMTQCADVLLKDPTNEFAKLQHEKFQLKFETKLSELERSASQSAATILDLTADSDSNDDDDDTKRFNPPTTITPK